MKLTKNFSLHELTRSAVASRKRLDNQPTGEHIEALRKLCIRILQPVRDKFGPVIVTSGYRAHAVNQAVGGSVRSQHVAGQAADFEVVGHDNLSVAHWIKEEGLPYDQLILEMYNADIGPHSGWVHVSYAPGYRKQVLTASLKDYKVIYEDGLPIMWS